MCSIDAGMRCIVSTHEMKSVHEREKAYCIYHRVFILSLEAERKNGFSVHDPPSISDSLNRVKLPLGLIKGTNGQGLVSSHYTLIPV